MKEQLQKITYTKSFIDFEPFLTDIVGLTAEETQSVVNWLKGDDEFDSSLPFTDEYLNTRISLEDMTDEDNNDEHEIYCRLDAKVAELMELSRQNVKAHRFEL